jgi:hypothetical protein
VDFIIKNIKAHQQRLAIRLRREFRRMLPHREKLHNLNELFHSPEPASPVIE